MGRMRRMRRTGKTRIGKHNRFFCRFSFFNFFLWFCRLIVGKRRERGKRSKPKPKPIESTTRTKLENKTELEKKMGNTPSIARDQLLAKEKRTGHENLSYLLLLLLNGRHPTYSHPHRPSQPMGVRPTIGQSSDLPCLLLQGCLFPLSLVVLVGLPAHPAAISLPLGEKPILWLSICRMTADPVTYPPFPALEQIPQPWLWTPSRTVLLSRTDACRRGIAIKGW
ncbi:hypothetical protein F4779DRAFT_565441 [Xylariaceae sp. FL0662B]|nr:hypothetical protein F4779DRAFT_565441 [Xylariaceae sp. FL0662B]